MCDHLISGMTIALLAVSSFCVEDLFLLSFPPVHMLGRSLDGLSVRIMRKMLISHC